jgi:hypothetical protein
VSSDSAEEFDSEAGDPDEFLARGHHPPHPVIRMEQRFGRTPSPFASEATDAHASLSASPLEELVENQGKTVDFREVFTG